MKLTIVILALFLVGSNVFAQEQKSKIVIIPVKGTIKLWKTNAQWTKNDNGQLKIKLSGSKWSGIGLNWAGWQKKSPKIVKAEEYKNFVIKLKIADGATNLKALSISFEDKEKEKSKPVVIGQKYAYKLKVGKVVQLTIPVSNFIKDAPKLKTTDLWTLIIGAYKTETPTNMEITLLEAYFTK